VPESFYKAILDYPMPELNGIGFILPNQSGSEPIWNFAVSIESVESQSGMDFFPMRPDEIEGQIEFRLDIGQWGMN